MIEETKIWWERSKKDLEVAEKNFKNKDYYASAFFCQQAIEKALKSININKGLGLIKTHDLLLLGRKVNLPRKLLEKAVLLNPVYTSSRYPISDEIFEERETEEFISYAKEILQWCKQQMKI